jgi:hypothetical protein
VQSVQPENGNASPSALSEEHLTLSGSEHHTHTTIHSTPPSASSCPFITAIYVAHAFALPSLVAERAAISSYWPIPPSSFLSCPLTKRKTVPGATPVSSLSESLLSAASSPSPCTPGTSLCGDSPPMTVLSIVSHHYPAVASVG